MALSENAGLAGCSDCVICGKTVQQIQREAVNDYIDKTVVSSETLAETERRKRVFLDGRLPTHFFLCQGSVAGGRLRWQLVFGSLRLQQTISIARNNSPQLRKIDSQAQKIRIKQDLNFCNKTILYCYS